MKCQPYLRRHNNGDEAKRKSKQKSVLECHLLHHHNVGIATKTNTQRDLNFENSLTIA